MACSGLMDLAIPLTRSPGLPWPSSKCVRIQSVFISLQLVALIFRPWKSHLLAFTTISKRYWLWRATLGVSVNDPPHHALNSVLRLVRHVRIPPIAAPWDICISRTDVEIRGFRRSCGQTKGLGHGWFWRRYK